MQILEQHIVVVKGSFQILSICKNGKYFITSNGGFGQREMYIEQIPESEALNLLSQ